MNKGSIIAFDELGNENWPGETWAFKDFCAKKRINVQREQDWLSDLEIKRFPWQSTVSYAVI